ncbi:hypothetical protein KM043_005078 [Ampulex compressa]|nr:hypothetical protein KM043_005078 [Ampulex compressa]
METGDQKPVETRYAALLLGRITGIPIFAQSMRASRPKNGLGRPGKGNVFDPSPILRDMVKRGEPELSNIIFVNCETQSCGPSLALYLRFFCGKLVSSQRREAL